MKKGTRSAPPRAGAMLESLRGLGYNAATALADIVDNSVSAGAKKIDIQFQWAGEHGQDSWVSILDNGRGMDDPELESAMTLGDKSPLDARDKGDLGRFGMGLKTASFSQCRRLTVASVKAGAECCLRWDLDRLAADASGEWLMLEGPDPSSKKLLEPLGAMKSGTLVLWEKLDRIVTASFTSADFVRLAVKVERHLAMVFHRLIEGTKPRFVLRVNGVRIEAWDPFMDGHPAKSWSSPIARRDTTVGPVFAEAHVLPHKDMLTKAAEESGGGPEGWTAQQGFYVYRNERLLVAGGWLGLGREKDWHREEFHRLARIRVDIPNTADADWKIDIRKSTASPPVALRPWLTKIAEDARTRARKVFAFRASPVSPKAGHAPIEQVWRVEHLASGIRYRIEEKHPAVAAVIEACGGHAQLVKAMLTVIEQTVPVQRIWLDTAENKDTPRTGFAGEPPSAVTKVLRTLYADMTGRKRMTPEAAKRLLSHMEPFQDYPGLVEALQIQPGPAGAKK